METRQFGKTDMQVSVLGFGGSEIRGASVADVEQLLGSAFDSGVNVIDTGECYGDSEDLIGRAVASRRSNYFLFTKCGHAVGDELPAVPEWDPRLLEASIERSLRRLRTDHLDLLQLHSCSLDVLRKGDVIKVLEKAKREGKTRYIGYSGDNEDARYAIHTGAFDTLQTSVSIADQQPATLTLPSALEKGMDVIAKHPIANAAWTKEEMPESEYAYPYFKRLQSLAYDFLHGPAGRGDGHRWDTKPGPLDCQRPPARWRPAAARSGRGYPRPLAGSRGAGLVWAGLAHGDGSYPFCLRLSLGAEKRPLPLSRGRGRFVRVSFSLKNLC